MVILNIRLHFFKTLEISLEALLGFIKCSKTEVEMTISNVLLAKGKLCASQITLIISVL